MSRAQDWPIVMLGEVAEDVQTGFARSPRGASGAVKQLRTNNIGLDGQLDFREVKTVTASFDEVSLYELRAGDVLFNNTNSVDHVGKTAYVECDLDAVFSNHMTRIRVDGSVMDGAFLSLALRVSQQAGFLAQRAKQWVSQAAIDTRMLARIPIPLPPLSEQREIVRRVRQAEVVRDAQTQQARKLAAVPVALYREVFGEPLANPHGYPVEPLGDHITEGPQNGLYKHASAYGSGTPIVRIGNFYDGQLEDPESFERVLLTDAETASYSLAEGDILLNRVNSIDYLGKCAWVRGLAEPTVYESNMMRFRVGTERLSPRYVVGFLMSGYAGQQIRRRAKQAVNQASINQTDVRQLQIPIPNPEDLSRFEELAAEVDRIEAVAREGAKVDGLVESVLAHAFTGTLTARWRKAHERQLEAEAAERDRQLGRSVRRPSPEPVEAPALEVPRPALTSMLSDPQSRLVGLLHREAAGQRYATAPSLLDRYDLADEGWTERSVQEALDLFEQTGLAHRVRAVVQATETPVYPVAYRPVGDGDRAAEDAELLSAIAEAG